jgi:hypothetical protein
MAPTTIYIIRHAEKPAEYPEDPGTLAWPGPGLTVAGIPDKKSLVIRGWQRAGAWATLFGGKYGGGEYCPPCNLYAANPKRDGTGGEPSHRPYETLIPLAANLRKPIDTEFAKGEEEKLAASVVALQEGGCALICWEHKAIVDKLLKAIDCELKANLEAMLPKEWPGYCFNAVLVFERTAEDWSFKPTFPILLSGDGEVEMNTGTPSTTASTP